MSRPMSKIFHVMYDDDAKVMKPANFVKASRKAVPPFPIHGIDHVIGIKRTRLAICSSMYA